MFASPQEYSFDVDLGSAVYACAPERSPSGSADVDLDILDSSEPWKITPTMSTASSQEPVWLQLPAVSRSVSEPNPTTVQANFTAVELNFTEVEPNSPAGTESAKELDGVFETVLYVPAGMPLGLSVMPVAIGSEGCDSGLLVRSIEEGGAYAIQSRTCSEDRMIRPGDCIVRAGRTILNANLLKRALTGSQEIRASVLRQVDVATCSSQDGKFLAVGDEKLPHDLHTYLFEACQAEPRRRAVSRDADTDDLGVSRQRALPVAPRPTSLTAFVREAGGRVEEDDGGLPVGPQRAMHAGAVFARETSGSGDADEEDDDEPEEEFLSMGHVRSSPAQYNVSKLKGPSMDSMRAYWQHHGDVEPAKLMLKGKARCDAKRAKAKADIMCGIRPTTLMLQQVPSTFSRNILVELLDSFGFFGMYDFVYLRRNLRKQMPFTYAFVNMTGPLVAEACFQALHGYQAPWCPGASAIVASWADSDQGLQANIERYRNSAVMHKSVPDDCKPALFKNGRRIDFPPPTTALKPPPVRKQLQQCEGAGDSVNRRAHMDASLTNTLGADEMPMMGKILSDCSTASTTSSWPSMPAPPGLAVASPAAPKTVAFLSF